LDWNPGTVEQISVVRVVTAKYPNHVYHVDLTVVPKYPSKLDGWLHQMSIESVTLVNCPDFGIDLGVNRVRQASLRPVCEPPHL